MIAIIKFCKCGCQKEVRGYNNKYCRNHKPLRVLNFCECGCNQQCGRRFVVGHAMRGRRHSDGTKKKMEQNHIGMSGMKHSEESKEKIRIGNIGKHNVSNETRKKLSESGLGKHKTCEMRLKLSLAHFGKRMSDKSKEKNRLAHLGHIVSDATKALLSIRQRKTWKERGDEIAEKRMCNKKWRRFSYVFNEIIIQMRSSWEVLYAQYLDSKELRWVYEPKCFKLSDGRRYFPDFYLPDLNEYHEVKGYMHSSAKRKLDLFVKDHPDICIKVIMRNDLIALGLLKG